MAKWEQVPGAINPLFLSTSAEEGVSSGGNVLSIATVGVSIGSYL